MKVDLGVYSKNKEFPKVYGPRRRVDRKLLKKRSIDGDENSNKKSKTKKIFGFLVIFLIFALIGGAIWRFNNYQSRVKSSGVNGENTEICDNFFNPECWPQIGKPTLKKTDNFTNMLILGIDKRPVGAETGLKNTDTIIVASINHETGNVMLVSIPRDMLIDIRIDGNYCCSAKVNSVYGLADSRSDVDDGVELLGSNLERLLGIELHYSAIVDFEAVKGVVDALGGIQVDVPSNLTVTYPDEVPPYTVKTYDFKKGLQTMDGKTALRWARFRKVYRGDTNFASDFSRARRQQQVIDAIKDKALADETGITEKAQKYWKIYQSLSEHITLNNASFEDALAAFALIEEIDIDPVNVVLDPNFMGLNTVVVTGNQSDGFGYHIKSADPTWSNIRTEIDKIWDYPGVFDDEATVVVSNQTGQTLAQNSKGLKLVNSDIPFESMYLLNEAKTNKLGVTIYDFTGGEMTRTVEFLKEYFGTDKVSTEPAANSVTQSGYAEDIKVVIGPPEPTPTTTNPETSDTTE